MNLIFLAMVACGFSYGMLKVWIDNGPKIPIIILVIGALVTMVVSITVFREVLFTILLAYGAL